MDNINIYMNIFLYYVDIIFYYMDFENIYNGYLSLLVLRRKMKQLKITDKKFKI